MIKHILKIIWNQRRSNGWIFAELLVVVAVLWVMMDSLLVDQYTYHSPLGFDIKDTYKVELVELQPGDEGYIDKQTLTTRTSEDVLRLLDNLRRAPEVEEIAIGATACPYSSNYMMTYLCPSDADSTWEAHRYKHSYISPEYFDVLRITDREGKPLRQMIGTQTGLVLTADLEEELYPNGGSAVGIPFKFSQESTERHPCVAVTAPIRRSEYEKSSPYMYQVQSNAELIKQVDDWPVMALDVLMRMRPGFPPEKMETFLQGMGERLTVNNVSVSSILPLSKMRAEMLKSREDNMKKKSALVAFMLINVFFGIIGTFWLRTQARKGEMGLRIALGSDRRHLSRMMNLEGLCLLALTIPFVLIFIVNMLYFDMPDTYRLAYTWWRFALTFGAAYLLMAGMISLGIWFPMRRAMQMEPAEALHYE